MQVDRRAYVYYMALGNSPAMMAKNVGIGSYYLWTYKDAAGDFLDGAKNYKLRIPANVPGKGFLVGAGVRLAQPVRVARTARSSRRSASTPIRRSMPTARWTSTSARRCPQGQEKNWIKTVPGKGWFPIFRFYGPLEPLYDKSWVLNDIERVN